MKPLLTALIFPLLLVACSSTPMKPQNDNASTVAPAKPASTSASPAAVASVETDKQKLDRIIKTLASNSIYFDYDDFSIKQQYRQTLLQDYEAMKVAPANALFRVVGNADERGGAEYNLALGQKRAEAVRRALVLLGMPDARLEAISYGEEKPRATCHEEKCWTENRRVDLTGMK